MAKVFYKNFSLCCELTNFAVEKVSISNPYCFPAFFLSIFPLQLCTILWINVPRIFLSLVVRETTSPRVIGFASDSIRHRCAFHVKSFQGFLIPAYTLLLSFSSLFFFLFESSSRSYTFPLKILGDRENSDDTFPLFLSLSHPGRFWPLVLSNTLTNARGNDRASRSQFISRVKLIFNATMLYR